MAEVFLAKVTGAEGLEKVLVVKRIQACAAGSYLNNLETFHLGGARTP